MKRIIAVLLVTILTVFMLAGCMTKKCDKCGKEADDLNKVEVDGEKVSMCDTCYAVHKSVEGIGSLVEGIKDAIN